MDLVSDVLQHFNNGVSETEDSDDEAVIIIVLNFTLEGLGWVSHFLEQQVNVAWVKFNEKRWLFAVNSQLDTATADSERRIMQKINIIPNFYWWNRSLNFLFMELSFDRNIRIWRQRLETKGRFLT